MVQIIWDFVSPRAEHWLEWTEGKSTHLRRVSEEEYQEVLAKADLDFLN